VDLAKYRAIFIEESAEHFAELGGALLELEKDPANAEAIDVVFRMAHSIKGMAASLDYTAIAEIAHRLEDRMQAIRTAGRVRPGGELSLLFRGLETLERMVDAVREEREIPPADPALARELSQTEPQEEPAPPEPVSVAEAEDAAPREPAPAPPAAPSPAASRAGSSLPADAPKPPPTVRVRTETLDRFLNTVGEVILNTSQVRNSAQSPGDGRAALGEDLDRMDRAVGELQRRALELRTTRLLRILEPLPRAAREVAERIGKRVAVEITGAELELDRSILDRLSDPLVHLLRNAVDHGIETPERRKAAGKPEIGRVVIEARREKDNIRLSVRDDGAGIDLDRLRARAVEAGLLHADLAPDLPPDAIAALVFEPGLSTAGAVSDISGRGVGMDAVRATIESLGGTVEITSEPGAGTATTLIVPITAAVQRVLLLGVGGETMALPIAKVERILELPAEQIERSGSEAFALIDDELIPVLDLAERVGVAARRDARDAASLVLSELRGERVALLADRVAGQQQIYVKPVPELLSGLRALSGLTILADGRPMFLLDLNQIT
jgi:two-component system chemotaxis sensor kinase CheA